MLKDTGRRKVKPYECTVGKVVQLNSGGPAMTVVNLDRDGDTMFATCRWIGEGGDVRDGTFPVACLKPY